MNFKLLRCFIILSVLLPFFSHAQDSVAYSAQLHNIRIGRNVQILEDKNNTLTPEQVINSKDFVASTRAVPVLGISKSSFWLKFKVCNQTDLSALALELATPTLDSVKLYSFVGNAFSSLPTGEYVPWYNRVYKSQNYIFNLYIPRNETRLFLLKISASDPIEVPLMLGTSQTIIESNLIKNLIFGLYAGIILVMFFYNLFIYFTTRDRSYLYYILYIITVGLTQACLQGYLKEFFYAESPVFANFMMVLIPASSGMTAIVFLCNFMQMRKFTPVLNTIIWITFGVYCVVIALGVAKQYQLAAQIMQGNVGLLAIIVFVTGFRISQKGYRPAKFFMIAWTVFLASVIVFVLRNAGVLEYNDFTYYSLEIGSSLEIVLLSFALADKINIFRKEKDESQAQALRALQENERIIREQNVFLEAKVDERTTELKETNTELNKTLKEPKEAETQLIESEKMASLGQLTAGIAHEINNPINFVTSNVKPLKRDVSMLLEIVEHVENIGLENISSEEKKKQIAEYKEEIEFDYLKEELENLLTGISDGASRTAEIVKGLRVFSRLDEDDLKKADINENMDSTLVIANNLIGNRIQLEKKYGNLPLAECFPGKLNQVFLNIISNGVYAIGKKFGDNIGGRLSIETTSNENNIIVKIADNGIGMDETTKRKLFEPFFTTKEVGEGTGLGMSIVYNTIVKHNGKISVDSKLGEGTEFTIEIPIIHNPVNA
jgi:signal transduction histidine kinase